MNEYFRYLETARIGLSDGSGEARLYRREDLRTPLRRGFHERDVFEFVLQGIHRATVTLVPPANWPAIARATSSVRQFEHRRRRFGAFRDATAAVMPDLDDDARSRLFDQFRRRQHERRIAVFREGATRGNLSFNIDGRQHLDEALARGRGPMIWTEPFAFQTILGKRGLAEAGYRIHQVSSSSHGFSQTVFGERILNRALVQAENAYLASRLVFRRDEANKVLVRALRLLQQGDAVFFTNNVASGRNFVEVPFGVSGWFSMPLTPIRLALRHGLPLLSMRTLERAPFSRYDIRLTSDLTAGLHLAPEDEAIAEIARRVSVEIFQGVLMAPDQFLNWPVLQTAPRTMP